MATTRSGSKSSGRKASASKGSGGKSSGSKKGRSGGRSGAAKRTTINTGSDKRFVRRGKGGQFKESDDVGRSLSADRRKKAKTASKAGQGDKGDRKP